jgi:cardiolipin synthase
MQVCNYPPDAAPPALSWDAPPTPGLHAGAIHLDIDGAQALATLSHLIDQATCRIDVLMFQWENDPIGSAIAERLVARAGPQLHVRILVDGGGNLIFGCPERQGDHDVNRVVHQLAGHPHVELRRIHNPFGRFDHRKLVVIDGRLAWAGGRNFTRCSFFVQHDLSFTVAGPLAADLARCFETAWQQQGGHPTEPLPEVTSLPDVDGPANANALGRLVGTGPLECGIEQAVYTAVRGARHHVYVENFTFSDSRLLVELARARRRGADVRVVLTLDTPTPALNHANRVIANRLVRAGVRVYVYPIMTHVKAAAVDGCWAYLGSGNFDPLSLRRNYELGLILQAGPILANIEQCLFQADFRPEWELHAPLPVKPGDYFWEAFSALCL